MGIIRFDIEQNPARNFGVIIKDLEEIARDTDNTVSTIIDMFITDMNNYYDEEYEKGLDINIKGLTPPMRSSLLTYLNKVKKVYKQKERQDSKKEKREMKMESNKAKTEEMENNWIEIEAQLDLSSIDKIEEVIMDIKSGKFVYELDGKEKKYVLKKLEEKSKDLVKEEERKEIEASKIERAMEQIEETFNENYGDNISLRIKYMQEVRTRIQNENGDIFNIKLGEDAEKELLDMLSDRISEDKDQLFFDQVRIFTRDFTFLRDYSEIINATHGYKKVKFTDLESYDRFVNLRNKLQRNYNGVDERGQIKKLLKSKKTDNGERKVLEARLESIDREIEKRESEGR